MCYKAFGKGIIVFSIAFFLGFSFMKLEILRAEIPNVEPVKFEVKQCDSASAEFNKYKNYSVEKLEKELIKSLEKEAELTPEIVIRNERTQDLTIEETKILRRNIKKDFPYSGDNKLKILMNLIKYKRGEISVLPYMDNCVEN